MKLLIWYLAASLLPALAASQWSPPPQPNWGAGAPGGVPAPNGGGGGGGGAPQWPPPPQGQWGGGPSGGAPAPYGGGGGAPPFPGPNPGVPGPGTSPPWGTSNGGPPVPNVTPTIPDITGTGLELESSFKDGPTDAILHSYVPKTFKKGNPLVVALHMCGGTGPAYFLMNPDWKKAADSKGFMMIFVTSPASNKGCWDVSSQASLKHDGGGDSNTIANMVKFTLQKYGCDHTKVFVTGSSSGGMMTQVMAATYPNLFAGASEYCGVPYSCFEVQGLEHGPASNASCAHGQVVADSKYWLNAVHQAWPDYKGNRPKMMMTHGTVDPIVNYQNLKESVKQWTAVFNQNPDKPTKTEKGQGALSNYDYAVYGTQVLAVTANGVDHSNPVQVDKVCEFFGL